MSERTRIRLFHPYLADLVRPGTRKPERIMAKAPIDLDVRTTSASELGIAAKFRRGDVTSAWREEYDQGMTFELHGYDGGLWQPMEQFGGEPLTVDAWLQAMVDGRPLPEPDPILIAQWRQRAGYARDWSIPGSPENLEGSFVGDDRARGFELATRAAEDILLVDDTVWRRSIMPFWSVERQSGLYTVHLQHQQFVDEGYTDRAGGPVRIASFGLDKLDEAMAYVGSYTAARHRNMTIKGPAGAVFELDLNHYGFDGVAANAVDLGGLALTALTEMVGSMTPRGVEHYAEARIAQERLAEGDGDHETVRDLATAIDGVVGDLNRFTFPLARIQGRDRILRESVEPFVERVAVLEMPRIAQDAAIPALGPTA